MHRKICNVLEKCVSPENLADVYNQHRTLYLGMGVTNEKYHLCFAVFPWLTAD